MSGGLFVVQDLCLPPRPWIPPAEVLAWARARLQLCVVQSELGNHIQARILAEDALRIMDPLLRDAVNPEVREEDISRGSARPEAQAAESAGNEGRKKKSHIITSKRPKQSLQDASASAVLRRS